MATSVLLLGVLLAVGSGTGYASLDSVRKRLTRDLSPLAILLGVSIAQLPLHAGLLVLTGWPPVSPLPFLGWVLLAGSLAILANVLLVMAFERAPLSLVVPMLNVWSDEFTASLPDLREDALAFLDSLDPTSIFLRIDINNDGGYEYNQEVDISNVNYFKYDNDGAPKKAFNKVKHKMNFLVRLKCLQGILPQEAGHFVKVNYWLLIQTKLCFLF